MEACNFWDDWLLASTLSRSARCSIRVISFLHQTTWFVRCKSRPWAWLPGYGVFAGFPEAWPARCKWWVCLGERAERKKLIRVSWTANQTSSHVSLARHIHQPNKRLLQLVSLAGQSLRARLVGDLPGTSLTRHRPQPQAIKIERLGALPGPGSFAKPQTKQSV